MANVAEIITQIEQLSVLELVELNKKLQENWGVSAAAAMPVAAVAPTTATTTTVVEEAPTEFNVVLTGLADPGKKVNVIKVVREITALGLKEAKEMVEGAPQTVKENVSKEEAAALKTKLEEGGATVDVKPA